MLTLPIKCNWYKMIVARIKTEEYRADTSYYTARFARYEGQRIQVLIRNGYNSKAPSAVCEVTPIRRVGGNPEWGADTFTPYWVLIIHSVREVQP